MASSVVNTRIKKADTSNRYNNKATIEINQNQTGGDFAPELFLKPVSVDSSFTGSTSVK